MGSLSTTLFPGVSSSVKVHAGFRDEHAKTAPAILAEVKRLMSVKGTTNVALVSSTFSIFLCFEANKLSQQVGHSLGGALAELDSLFLTLNLPSSTSIKAVTYGTPRVGAPAFAALIDSKVMCFSRSYSLHDLMILNVQVPNFRRINNEDGAIICNNIFVVI